jgi:hypothetical protein
VVRYSFIAVDSHHLLLASLPAHSHGFCCSPGCLLKTATERATKIVALFAFSGVRYRVLL